MTSTAARRTITPSIWIVFRPIRFPRVDAQRTTQRQSAEPSGQSQPGWPTTVSRTQSQPARETRGGSPPIKRPARLLPLHLRHLFLTADLAVFHRRRARARLLVNEHRSALLAFVSFSGASGHLDLRECRVLHCPDRRRHARESKNQPFGLLRSSGLTLSDLTTTRFPPEGS